MRIPAYLIIVAVLLSTIFFNKINAFNWCDEFDSYLDISGGYRLDEISSSVRFINKDHLEIATYENKDRNLPIYEVGTKGWVSYCNWYLRGSGYWGWGKHGNHREKKENILDVVVARRKAEVEKIRTHNANLGIGYMFSSEMWDQWLAGPWSYQYDCMDFCDDHIWWGVGPAIGYSYDCIFVKSHHVKLNGRPDPILTSVSNQSKWQGPWFGIDFALQYYQFDFTCGYEYHWGIWRGFFIGDLKDSSEQLISHRKSKHADGSILYFEGRWNICSTFNLGLGIKLQDWKASHGHVHNFFENTSHVTTREKFKHARWYSAGITFDLGYLF
jgi:hypothetical protein